VNVKMGGGMQFFKYRSCTFLSMSEQILKFQIQI
jgi:hypothetical protein